MLFHRLKTRYPDFRRYAEGLTCSSPTEALIWTITREFDQREHNLFIPANIDENMIDENGFFRGDGITVRGDSLTRHSYHYQNDGSIAEAVSFLALVELWRQEPIVRQLYRKTSNEVTVPICIRNTNEFMTDGYLHYDLGEATAEDELIQKIRLHFGYGSRAALVARANRRMKYSEKESWPVQPSAGRSYSGNAFPRVRGPQRWKARESADFPRWKQSCRNVGHARVRRSVGDRVPDPAQRERLDSGSSRRRHEHDGYHLDRRKQHRRVISFTK